MGTIHEFTPRAPTDSALRAADVIDRLCLDMARLSREAQPTRVVSQEQTYRAMLDDTRETLLQLADDPAPVDKQWLRLQAHAIQTLISEEAPD